MPEGIRQIESVLDWLGLHPDEGIWQGEHTGDAGPYIQSERLPKYAEIAEQLIAEGLAYRSVITPDDFARKREAAISAKKPFVYRRVMEPAGEGKATHPVRLDIVAVAEKLGIHEVKWADAVRGEFTVAVDTLDDMIIMKADGFPTYNFANIVDDHLMRISHIMRGDEFISSTPKHALLYDAMGYRRPVWAHLPVILGNDGAKLSKRHGDTDALQYRDKGYEPEALLNFLALLGWNDGTEQELFRLPELIEKFSLERVQKSPAKFDLERLNWLNGRYIREVMTEDAYEKRALAALETAGLPARAPAPAAVRLERERIKFFSELPSLVDFFIKAPTADPHMRELLAKKLEARTVHDYLAEALKALNGSSDDEADIEARLRDRAQELAAKPGDFFSSIRIAITGRTQAPGLFETIAVLGIAETRRRLAAAVNLFT